MYTLFILVRLQINLKTLKIFQIHNETNLFFEFFSSESHLNLQLSGRPLILSKFPYNDVHQTSQPMNILKFLQHVLTSRNFHCHKDAVNIRSFSGAF